jgi:hypothetical protein
MGESIRLCITHIVYFELISCSFFAYPHLTFGEHVHSRQGPVNELLMNVHERVRWYVMFFGSNVDAQSVQWVGANVVRSDLLRVSTVDGFPGAATSVNMIADASGEFVIVSRAGNNSTLGMSTGFSVWNPLSGGRMYFSLSVLHTMNQFISLMNFVSLVLFDSCGCYYYYYCCFCCCCCVQQVLHLQRLSLLEVQFAHHLRHFQRPITCTRHVNALITFPVSFYSKLPSNEFFFPSSNFDHSLNFETL